jgi:Kef-type K+ transport system membrane component KefB
MSTTILIIGALVFLAHFLALQFRHTNVPDVLVLVLLGILIGPVLGIADRRTSARSAPSSRRSRSS